MSINAGTSGRDWLTPMGNCAHKSVKTANQMVSRRLNKILSSAKVSQGQVASGLAFASLQRLFCCNGSNTGFGKSKGPQL